MFNQVHDPQSPLVANIDAKNIKCLMCYGAHHGEDCRRLWETCFECHVPVQSTYDHAENCGAKKWFRSEKYVEAYVKTPAVRMTIEFADPVSVLLSGVFVTASAGMDLFSGMADTQFKFASQSQVELRTTRFTRIRVPIVIPDGNGRNDNFYERIVFMTSHDRTIVAANSSRVMHQSHLLADFEHNTPLVLQIPCAGKLLVTVHSGGRTYEYAVDVNADGKKYAIPDELGVKSTNFTPKMFDAELPMKKLKSQ